MHRHLHSKGEEDTAVTVTDWIVIVFYSIMHTKTWTAWSSCSWRLFTTYITNNITLCLDMVQLLNYLTIKFLLKMKKCTEKNNVHDLMKWLSHTTNTTLISLFVCRSYSSLLFSFLHLPGRHVLPHHVRHAADFGWPQAEMAGQALHARCAKLMIMSWSSFCDHSPVSPCPDPITSVSHRYGD